MLKINWSYYTLSLIVSYAFAHSIIAQSNTISFTQLPVQHEESLALVNPFAGGVNSGQFNEIDLDLDGTLDLAVFDRTSNKLSTFLFKDGGYQYAPKFEYQFPEQLINWVLLRDYNCDDKNDLFTSTSLGIKVYRNTSIDSLTWEQVADPIITLGNSSINLFVNSTDLPAIVDVDGDDDLDILVFNFATGGFVEFHENVSIDQYNSCDSLEYVRVTREWGDFQECFCGTFAFDGEVCDGSNRTLHISGKALTVDDIDGDGLADVLFGEEECGDLFSLPNSGSQENALFRESQLPFPQLTDQLFFPGAYFIDIDHDGNRDLVISPNDRGNELDLHNFRRSVYTSQRANGQFMEVEDGFLQSNMIDVGERSTPALGDIDNDGDLDLLIGNRGSITGVSASASLEYYENTGSRSNPNFTRVTSDFLNLSSLGLSYLRPNLKDLDRDGLIDLAFVGLISGENRLHIIPGQSGGFEIGNLTTHSAPLNELDEYDLHDINRDGNVDLLVGTSGGRLDLYLNIGTNLAPFYELEEQGYLGLNVNPFRTNLSIHVQEQGNSVSLITYDDSGELRRFTDIERSNTSDALVIDDLNAPTRLGRIGSLSLGSLRGGQFSTLLFGNIQGGLQAFSLANDEPIIPPSTDWQVNTYPNPSNGQLTILSSETATGRLIGLSGKLLLDGITINPSENQKIDISHLPQGLYVLQLISHNQGMQHLKIVIDE